MRSPVGTDQARRDPALRQAFARVERDGRRGLASLQDSLSAYMRATGLTRRRRESPVYAAFETAAGPALAAHARPVRFAKGTLTVEVDSAAHLHELEAFRGRELRVQANDILGREDIRRIAFRPKH